MPNEPCTRCPPFVVRCGHLGEDVILIVSEKVGWFTIRGPRDAGLPGHPVEVLVAARGTRAEADDEFDRREEALLG